MKYQIRLTGVVVDEKDLPNFIKENLVHKCISYDDDEELYLDVVEHIFNKHFKETILENIENIEEYLKEGGIGITYYIKRPPIFKLSWKTPLAIKNKNITETYFTGLFCYLLEWNYLCLYSDDKEIQNKRFIKMLLKNDMIKEINSEEDCIYD